MIRPDHITSIGKAAAVSKKWEDEKNIVDLTILKSDDGVCPDCRIKMIRLGGCFSCPLCGLGSCG